MSTENLSIDQAVDKMFMAEEPVQEVSEEDIIEESETDAQVEDDVTEDDSEVDYSDEYDSEDDTDEESTEYDNEPVQSWTDDTVVPVKVDGQDGTATIAELKRAFAGQGKIQKGMQEAAEARKQAQELQQQINVVAQRLSAMYQNVQQNGFVSPPVEPTKELFDSDPIGYMEAKMQYDSDMKAYNEQQQQMMQLRQYEQQQQAMTHNQRIQQELQLMNEKIPEFSDPEKAGKFKEDLFKTANEFYGYSPQDLQGVTDHRAMLVLRDAMMWRKSQSKKSQIEEKANKARPVIKPQAKRTADPKRKQVQQSKSTLKKTGSINDAINLMFQ